MGGKSTEVGKQCLADLNNVYVLFKMFIITYILSPEYSCCQITTF